METIKIYLLPVLFIFVTSNIFGQDDFYSGKATPKNIDVVQETADSSIFLLDNYSTEEDYYLKHNSGESAFAYQLPHTKDCCRDSNENHICDGEKKCARKKIDWDTVGIVLDVFVEVALLTTLFWN